MTAATVAPLPRYRVTFGHDLKSEWIKLRSLRSTWFTLAATLLIMMGIGFLGAFAVRSEAQSGSATTADAAGIQTIVISFIFAQMSIAVLGCLTITGEYATGMIRSTLAADPRRLPALWAKSIVIAAVTAVVAAVGILLTFVATIPVLSGVHLVANLSHGEVLKAFGAYVLYLVLVALLSVGVGAMVRHSAGAIFTMVAILFIIYMVSQFFSQQWIQDVARFLPMDLGITMMMGSAEGGPDALTQAQSIAAMVVWALVAQVGAAVLLVRRDA